MGLAAFHRYKCQVPSYGAQEGSFPFHTLALVVFKFKVNTRARKRWTANLTDFRGYLLLKLMLQAKIELENLLPYDIQYKVFDKDTNHIWNSFRKGRNTPVHSIDLNHLVLSSVKFSDSGA